MTGNRCGRRWFLPLLLLIGVVTSAAAVVALSNLFIASRTTDYIEKGVRLSADLSRNIAFPNGKYLSGTVQDASGAAVGLAIIQAVSDDGFVTAQTASGPLGNFKLSVRPGNYRLEVRPPVRSFDNLSDLPRSVPVTMGSFRVQKDTRAGIVTLPDGYLVTGQISTDAGTAKTLFGYIAVVPADGGSLYMLAPAVWGSGAKSRTFGLILPAGRFSLNFVSGQAFDSRWNDLAMSSLGSATVTVSADRVANVRVPRGSKVQGTVRDKLGKWMNGLLFIRKSGSSKRSVFGEGETTMMYVMTGSFRGYLPVGSYEAVFVPRWNRRYTGRGTKTMVSFDVPLKGVTVPITAASGVFLRGKITDARGLVVKTASLTVIPSTADPMSLEAVPLSAKSDEVTGDYSLCVPAGTYDIQAVPIGFGEMTAVERLAIALR